MSAEPLERVSFAEPLAVDAGVTAVVSLPLPLVALIKPMIYLSPGSIGLAKGVPTVMVVAVLAVIVLDWPLLAPEIINRK